MFSQALAIFLKVLCVSKHSQDTPLDYPKVYRIVWAKTFCGNFTFINCILCLHTMGYCFSLARFMLSDSMVLKFFLIITVPL